MSKVRISARPPSAARAAETLGVPKKVAKDLSLLAERSLKTGQFELPGVGSLIRVHRKPATAQGTTKRVVKFRGVKTAKDVHAARNKK